MSVNGTDVKAPIRATKSLKNGTAFETRYEETETAKVSISHLVRGSVRTNHEGLAAVAPETIRYRSMEEHSA